MNLLKKKTKGFNKPQLVKKAGLYPFFREIQSEQGTEVIVQGKKSLMFGSNSYLGLTTHPKVKEAAKQAIDKYGTSSAGSRFLNGTLDIHNELEERIAKFVGKEAAITFSTGFQVNVGVIPALVEKGDHIIIDRLNHASIIEGARLSQANTVIYRHNDMANLEQKLRLIGTDKFKLIVVDGIFSMEGDIVKLPEIVALAEKYNANVMTDCAHAIGVLGSKGQGTPAHFGLTDKVDLIGGTFSKSLASLGGFIAGDKQTINYIKHHSRSLIFSASITPAAVASTLAALDIIENEDEHIKNLWDNTNYMLNVVRQMGFNTGDGETPIIPIYVGDDYKTAQFTKKLLDEGIFVNPVFTPAVQPGDTLIRLAIMATHSKEQLDYAADKLYKVGKKLKLFDKSKQGKAFDYINTSSDKWPSKKELEKF